MKTGDRDARSDERRLGCWPGGEITLEKGAGKVHNAGRKEASNRRKGEHERSAVQRRRERERVERGDGGQSGEGAKWRRKKVEGNGKGERRARERKRMMLMRTAALTIP